VHRHLLRATAHCDSKRVEKVRSTAQPCSAFRTSAQWEQRATPSIEPRNSHPKREPRGQAAGGEENHRSHLHVASLKSATELCKDTLRAALASDFWYRHSSNQLKSQTPILIKPRANHFRGEEDMKRI